MADPVLVAAVSAPWHAVVSVPARSPRLQPRFRLGLGGADHAAAAPELGIVRRPLDAAALSELLPGVPDEPGKPTEATPK
ncbi:MAG: hypothetical protein OXG67_09115 [bacterium]|nr:hypothetical protein [bacterium]MCY3888533.1 hypothetical protein [bacterium]